MRRVLKIALGAALLGVGILGVVLPLIPAILLIPLGFVMLATEVPYLRRPTIVAMRVAEKLLRRWESRPAAVERGRALCERATTALCKKWER